MSENIKKVEDIPYKYQNTVFKVSSRTPVEHSRWIVFHFCFFKIKIFRLIICNANLQTNSTIVVYIISTCRATGGPKKLNKLMKFL